MSALMRRARSTTPLSHSALSIEITDLIAEYTLRHVFSNQGNKPIEVVYSFPVPLDAAFLGLSATLAGEKLEARVELRTRAEQDYDDAMAEGHSAVLLSAPEPGLLCVSLGNLKPDEEGEIVLRFATSLRVADGCARLNLPLTHRPRYGNWQLEELSTPTHDFAVEHPLSLDIRATGLLGSSHARCLSHPAVFQPADGGQLLQLDDALMDRDVAVVFELTAALKPTVRCITDGDGTLGMISIPVPPGDAEAQPLDLVLLLDCSGSMQGDAIEQSRSALLAIAKALSPQDRIQIIRFGGEFHTLFRRPLKATPQVCATIQELQSIIESDMGGTEMGLALKEAQRHVPEQEAARRRALILITDGAVQPADVADQQDQLFKSCIPTFVVAVGSTAGVEVLRPLAETTQAALERAVPMEPIDACVMRLFRRARKRPVSASAVWPSGLHVELISMPLAFPGDVLVLAARWTGPMEGDVQISMSFADEPLILPLLSVRQEPALRALLGQRQIEAAAQVDRARVAVEYGLLTEDTSAVLVRYRASGDRAEVLPEIVTVPQMVSEGIFGVPMYKCASSVLPGRNSMPARCYPSLACYDLGTIDGLEMPDMDSSEDSYELSGFADEDPTEAEAKPVLETRMLPAVSAERIREVVQALYLKLVAAYLTTPSTNSDLQSVANSLPESLRQVALEFLQALNTWLSDVSDSPVSLLLAMTKLEFLPPLFDQEEVRIPLLAHEFGIDEFTQTLLLDDLRDLVESGVPEREVSIPSRAQ